MKKLLVLLSVIMMLTSFSSSFVFASESTEGIEISCVDGEILVNGSFTAEEKAGEIYNIYLATYEEDGTLLKVDKSEDLTVTPGANKISFTAPNVRNVQHMKAFFWTKNGLSDLCPSVEDTVLTLKVLGIGNSFTMDAMEWLYKVAADYGIDNIVLGYAYKGGCSLETHWSYASNNTGGYTYYKNTADAWTTKSAQKISTMLADEDWNLIVVQQVSHYSGMVDTFEPYLSNLIEYVNERKTNKYAQLAWHATWAYSETSTHSGYENYNSNQMTMYNAIVEASEYIKTLDEIDFIIPSGTAIQNGRSSYIKDSKFTRDGYHLSYNLGRYIAAMTWFKKIFNVSLKSINWVPDKEAISSPYLKVVRESVENAVKNPDGVTVSQYQSAPTTADYEFYLDDYNILEWNAMEDSFYNSTEGSTPKNSGNSTSELLPYYICSPIFTKEDIPVGSMIIVENGYQYRAEGWKELDTPASVRGTETTTKIVNVTSSWWGEDNYKAFNICKKGGSEVLTGNSELVLESFHILVPKVLPEEPETPEEEEPVSAYRELELGLVSEAFYYSTNTSGSTLMDEVNYPENTTRASYAATRIFRREDIPNGSIIEVDEGYRYRPEGWVSLNKKNSLRPDNVTTASVVVDDAWWGDYNYRAFNISLTTGAKISTADPAAHFRIKVPQKTDEYIKLDYKYYANTFYQCSNSNISKPYTGTADINTKYVATKIFHRDELPNGTILEIDPGYQYRPEGWSALDKRTTVRPDNVTTEKVVIDDAWWGKFNYRAFNIAYEGAATTITDPDEVASHFRILVPQRAARLVELNLSHYGLGFYDSTKDMLVNTVDDTANTFLATEILTKTMIPEGSKIMVELGYQYLPDGWTKFNAVNIAEERPVTVTDNLIEVNSEWWGNFTHRAFNISSVAGDELTGKEEETLDKFHILVPNTVIEQEEIPETPSTSVDAENMGLVSKAFYLSTGSTGSALVTEGNAPAGEQPGLYAATKIFRKEELPEGTVIEIDDGYKYRPEGWVNLNEVNSSRPDEVTTKRVVIDDAWWGDYNYRAFNIALTSGAEIGNAETVASHFRIILPETEEEYIELDYSYIPNAFYQSNNSYISTPYTTGSTAQKFVATGIFHKDELPNGTVIEVDAGYQYRPEGWIDLNKITSSRPDNVTTERVVIDDEWWGDYNYRAFNLAYKGASTVITDAEELVSHFRILVPKNAKRLVRLDLRHCGAGFYNSTGGMNVTSGTDFANCFLATEVLTKSMIPAGSKIFIEKGYGYRPEGWTGFNAKTASAERPEEVTSTLTEVGESWWGEFTYRAFNIYKTSSTSFVGIEDSVLEKIHILVPAQ